MASSTELSSTRIRTRGGHVTATVYDKVGVDRLYGMLFHASWAAKYARKEDKTKTVSRSVKSAVVFPE